MKSKTLSRVTKYVFIWTAATAILISTNAGMIFLLKFISMRQINIIFTISVFSLFIFIASRTFSYLALSAHKGLSLKNLNFSYKYFYILLTDEARQEWRDFAAKERERIGKQTETSI